MIEATIGIGIMMILAGIGVWILFLSIMFGDHGDE